MKFGSREKEFWYKSSLVSTKVPSLHYILSLKLYVRRAVSRLAEQVPKIPKTSGAQSVDGAFGKLSDHRISALEHSLTNSSFRLAPSADVPAFFVTFND